jgi:hypothetical protein
LPRSPIYRDAGRQTGVASADCDARPSMLRLRTGLRAGSVPLIVVRRWGSRVVSRFTTTAGIMAENEEGGSTRGSGRVETRRIRCWNCYKAFHTHADGPCPHCRAHNQVRRRESLGYRILMVFLWADVAITLISVVYLVASCS